MVDDILDSSKRQFARVNDDLVSTRANLSFDVFRDICLICCVPFRPFEEKSTFIDILLLKRRNAIAHGEDTFIDITDLDELTTETVALMRTFGDALENQVVLQGYKVA